LNLEFIEGPELKNLLAAGVECLDANKEEINDLNVFPVPDGDTGTNMVLTLQAALREAQQASDEVKDILERAARGSLMGARGNSGVIVSQFFRGFARAVGDAPRLGTQEIAKGIEGASKLAYQAIRKPVEGTILTIVREAAAKARELQKDKLPLADFLVQIYQHILEVLEKRQRPGNCRRINCPWRISWSKSTSIYWRFWRKPRKCCPFSSRLGWWMPARKGFVIFVKVLLKP